MHYSYLIAIAPDESWKPGTYTISILATSKKFAESIAVSSQPAVWR